MDKKTHKSLNPMKINAHNARTQGLVDVHLQMMALPVKCCLVMFNLSSLINNMLCCLPLELQVSSV